MRQHHSQMQRLNHRCSNCNLFQNLVGQWPAKQDIVNLLRHYKSTTQLPIGDCYNKRSTRHVTILGSILSSSHIDRTTKQY